MAFPRFTITGLTVFLAIASSAICSYAADEKEIGEETDRKIVAEFGLYDDPKLAAYVTGVGQRTLAKIHNPEYVYRFRILDHEMVNAMALPGGYIYVTRGLLAALNSEAALAGVLGHEIGHVIGHHAMKQMNRSLGSLLLSLGALAVPEVRQNAAAWLTVTQSLTQQILTGYGREMEMESDQVGMVAAHEAGYDPNGIVDFLHSMRTLERLGAQTYHSFSATHPDTITRIIEAEQKAELLKRRPGRVTLDRNVYFDAISGVRYGKPKWRRKTYPPYLLKIHTVRNGETFGSIARKSVGDEGFGIEIAALNNMEPESPLEPGIRIKTIAPAPSITSPLLEKRQKERPGKKKNPSPGKGE